MFNTKKFTKTHKPTIGADFLKKKLELPDGRIASLQMWDTAGQERYHALNVSYYRYSKGALIVYDVTDKDSFEKVKKWHIELNKYLPGAPIMIAGNKCDLVNRTVPEEEAE